MAVKQTFQNTLEQLRSLQEILHEKFTLEKKIHDLPKEIELKEEMVYRMKENYLQANEQYLELKQSVMLKNDELNRLQEHRDKYEKEIAKVNSQRDYEQIDRAIKDNLDQEQIMRSELHSLEKKLERFTEEFTVTENLLKEQEEELSTIKQEIDSQLSDCESSLKGIKTKEEAITGGLDDKLTFKFERIIKSKGGDGIVPVRKNICNGCHMILPLQFVNEIQKEEEMLHCPYCSRILYFDSDVAGDFEVTETAGLQDLFEEEEIDFEDDFSVEDYEIFMDKDNIGSDSYIVPTETESDDDDAIDMDDDDDDEEEDVDLEEDGIPEEDLE